MEYFAEPVLDNRFLADYYQDMDAMGVYSSVGVSDQTSGAPSSDRWCTQSLGSGPNVDRGPEMQKYLHGLGQMTDAELDLYYDYFKRLTRSVHQPDLIIFLRADESVCMERIHERGGKRKRAPS